MIEIDDETGKTLDRLARDVVAQPDALRRSLVFSDAQRCVEVGARSLTGLDPALVDAWRSLHLRGLLARIAELDRRA
jgi:hypothetical protein